jgi:plasmid maintenance system antidote protein VapI
LEWATVRSTTRAAHVLLQDLALSLVFLGMEAEFWVNLQGNYDLALTREALAENLAAIHPLEATA